MSTGSIAQIGGGRYLLRVTRIVTLVLADEAGDVLGALPPFEAAVPWWQEAGDVVAAARELHGAEVTVLRLLAAERPFPPGGAVTYLAQVHGAVPALAPAQALPDPDPLRAPWAVPGGPAASIAWATSVLGRDDVVAVQQRTWNLSALWRLEAGGAPVAWLKQVPPWLGHETAVLRLVAAVEPALVPRVLAAGDAGRELLAHVPGEDRYGAGVDLCAAVARSFHRLQVHFAGRTGELLAAGVPDRRAEADRLTRAAEPWLDEIEGLADLIDELPARLAAARACGVPETLVHGDLHPGNVRESAGRQVIVDWGDSGVGHPAYDILRLTEHLPVPDGEALIDQWAGWWCEAEPSSDPGTAVELLRPVVALRQAAVYQEFVDRIERTERPYHEADIPERLGAAVEAARPGWGGESAG